MMTIDELAEGKAREIADDCAYMICRGRSLSMTSEEQKREDLRVVAITGK